MNNIPYWPFPTEPRPNQNKALKWLEQQEAKYLILESPVGCHAKGASILMFDGSTKMVEHIQINDELMGPDSKKRIVKCLHRGTDMMIKIIPSKSDTFYVNENHILSLISTNTGDSDNRFTGTEIFNMSVKQYQNQPDWVKSNLKLYRPNFIDFHQTNKLPIKPYLLGVLLGDGTICNGQVGITTADIPIVEYITEQATLRNLKINIQRDGNGGPASTFYMTTGHRGGDYRTREKNSLLEDLRTIGVYGTKSNDKFIPTIYKTASRSDRLQLLAGLIDTDGYHKNNVFEVTSKSEQLVLGIQYIARSLGLAANLMDRYVDGNTYVSVFISGNTNEIPTKLKRKQATNRLQPKRVNVEAFTSEPLQVQEYYGFEVDQDNLYVMGNFFVTHNSGKSNIGLAYSHYLTSTGDAEDDEGLPRPQGGSSYILTPQRILQAQYEQSFINIPGISISSFYGKGNYTCNTHKTTCDIGSVLNSKCTDCPYNTAKILARNARNTVLNYKLGLMLFEFNQSFKKRELVVFDEAHTLENHLIEFDALKVTEWRCKQYKMPFKLQKSLPHALDWMRDVYLPNLHPIVRSLELECEGIKDKASDGRKLTPSELKKLREYDSLSEHADEVGVMAARDPEYIDQNFVLVHEPISFQFKRLYGAYTFSRLVKPMAEKFLFMSSTILNKDGFCKDLGIPPEDTAFLSLDSDFPPDNRPVYYIPTTKMNAKWKLPENGAGRAEMLKSLKAALEIHKEDSGIIHTGNFEIAKWLVENLDGKIPHHIYHHNPDSGDDRNSIIEAFTNDVQPRVLISPSSTEGLDLKEDLGRFAIFVKIPFKSLGDQWVKRRMELSSEWYQRQALISVIQGGGRIVRSKDDWGKIYIFDSLWSYLFKQTSHMVPRWWKDSIVSL